MKVFFRLYLQAGFLLACAGCIGPHYKEHPLVVVTKKQPPELQGPYDQSIAQNLSTNPWPKSLVSPVAGVGNVIFKSMGISGWKDYHMLGEAQGVVVQHQIESSGFVTVDLRLNSLKVDEVPIPIKGTKYMRLEIFLGNVSVDNAIRDETNEVVTADGKLVWDSDGWFEIHPQKTGDVRLGDEP
jgi:hypothetical protein